MFQTPEQFTLSNARLDEALATAGRDLNSVSRSMMTGCIFAANESELKQKLEARGRTLEEMHQRGIVTGTPDMIREQLQKLEAVGLQRIMLQWLDLDDLKGLEALARAVL